MSGSDQQYNEVNITSRYSEVVLPDREPIHPLAKYSAFKSTYDCPEIYIKFTKVVMSDKLFQ